MSRELGKRWGALQKVARGLWQGFSMVNLLDTLPETSSSPLKIGRKPKGTSSSNHWFTGAMLVSGRVHHRSFFPASFRLKNC